LPATHVYTRNPGTLPAEPADQVLLQDRTASQAASPARASEVSPAWGRRVHEVVPAEAARALPDSMPPLLRNNAERLAVLGPHPDRWRMEGLPHLRSSEAPDHYMNLEVIQGQDLPPDRYAYARLLEQSGVQREGQGVHFNGTLPYGLAEHFDTLTAEFALYRLELDQAGKGNPNPDYLHQLEENLIHEAGMMSHYVADATQPLHSTVHFDGWNERIEPNPGGFRTRKGLHKEFEVFLANQVVNPTEVRQRLGAPSVLEGDPLNFGMDLLKQSHGRVKRLYSLEAQGRLNPWTPSPEGRELVTEQVVTGARALRDLWYTAWVRSETVARTLQPGPEGPASHEGFLLRT